MRASVLNKSTGKLNCINVEIVKNIQCKCCMLKRVASAFMQQKNIN